MSSCFLRRRQPRFQAKSSSYVKYESAQKEYNLFQKSGRKITKPGLYQIRGKMANGHSFDGVYYVSSNGQIVVTPGKRQDRRLPGNLGRLRQAVGRQRLPRRRFDEDLCDGLPVIPVRVPLDITVANKTGENFFASHDISIVYSHKCTYILCVMILNRYNADSRIVQISKANK